MWNCSVKCKMCSGEFEEKEHTSQYRRNIVKTGTAHLFDELVDWNSIRIDESLPFCSFCLESIENISSLSANCDLIRKEVQDLADKFTMESLRNRKQIKSNSGLLPTRTTYMKQEQETKARSNCVICYGIYFEGHSIQPIQSVQDKKNILKICETYLLPAILKNECQFDWENLPMLYYEPFCTKCSLNVHRIFELGKQVELASEKIKEYADSVTLQCLKNQKKQNTESNGASAAPADNDNLPEDDAIIISDEEDSSSSVDPLDLDTNTYQHKRRERNYSPEQILPDIFVEEGFDRNFDLTTQTPAFTRQKSNTSDLPGASSGSSKNKETVSENRGKKPAKGRYFLKGKQTMAPASFQANTKNFRTGPIKNVQKPVHTCSSCKKIFTNKNLLSEHQRNDSRCDRFFKNVSDKPRTPTPQKGNHYPDEPRGKLKVDEGSKKSLRTRTPKTKCICGDSHVGDFQHHQRKKKPPTPNCCKISKTTGRPKRVVEFNCAFCGEQLTSPLHLSIHCQTHYDEALETRCEICTFVYARKVSLVRHMRLYH